LEGHRGVGFSKGDHKVLEVIKWSGKGCFRDLGLRNTNSMVRKLEINYGEALRALCLVNHVLDSGNWEEVTHHVLIQDAVGFLLKKTRLKQPKESY